MNVLILEDDVGLAELLAETLSDIGFSTEWVGLGSDAIGAIARGHFDLVILDYNLPDMTGEQIWRKIKEMDANPPACIVATGEGDENIAVEMMKAGVRDYLVKDIGFLDKIPSVVQRVAREVENETQLLATQKKLSNTYKLIESVIEQSPAAKMIVSPDGTLEKINSACFEILGIDDRTDIRPGANIFELTPSWELFESDGTGVPVEKSPLFRALQGETVRDCELRIVRQDGSTRWIAINGCPIHDNEQKLLAGYVSFSDITHRKQAERALQESEERFSKAFHHSPDTIAITRMSDGKIIDTNLSFEKMFQIPRTQAIGKTVVELGIWKDSESRESVVKMLREDRQIADMELCGEYFRSSGEPIDVLLSADTITIAGEACIVGILRDITEHNKKEAEKNQLEAQLNQSQKMESVGRLAGGVAHDFNNMLGVILGYGEMMLDELDSSLPIYSRLQQIVDAAERSAELTKQLLAFARKQTVTPKVLDLNDTIGNMTQMLQRVIGEDMALFWEPGEKLHPVRMDPGQTDQILVNLCVNARDAIADVGKVTIKTQNVSIDEAFCDARPGFIPGAYVKVSVSDNGCGMSKETVQNIFEPFFTTKKAGEGTGLGLSTVYGIVKQNNGHIDVDSEPGKGTVIEVYIPRYFEKFSATPEDVTRRPSVGGNATILLVEDEPSILVLTTSMLAQMGYTVVSAGTPGEAIRLARDRSGDIHLLVTDVVMPEMNGRNLAKNILSFRPDIKCLFMSGYTADVIAHHGVVDEGVNFISKPFRYAELAAKVHEALSSN